MITAENANHPPIAAPLRELTTERLDLRRFRPDDLYELAILFENREVWLFPYGRAFTREETSDFLDAQIQEWDDRGFGFWIAREKTSNRVIGCAGISVPMFLPQILPAVEVGWRFDPAVWGMGYASEGARAALAEGFDTLGLEEIYYVPQAENTASSRVCDRIGMRLERQVKIPGNSRPHFVKFGSAV